MKRPGYARVQSLLFKDASKQPHLKQTMHLLVDKIFCTIPMTSLEVAAGTHKPSSYVTSLLQLLTGKCLLGNIAGLTFTDKKNTG